MIRDIVSIFYCVCLYCLLDIICRFSTFYFHGARLGQTTMVICCVELTIMFGARYVDGA